MAVHVQSGIAPSLEKLSRVDLHEIWTNEAMSFTPWLVKEEHLQMLGEAIRRQLVLEDKEKLVGMFRADLIARDVQSGHLVLIENQRARTNHGQLGHLITDVAGLKAESIVWMSSLFTDEHCAAMDWLNEITNSNIAFFGLEMELWCIDDSSIAPKLNLVSRLNTFSRQVNRTNQARFDKAACIHQRVTVRPELRNADIQGLADEFAVTRAEAIRLLLLTYSKSSQGEWGHLWGFSMHPVITPPHLVQNGKGDTRSIEQ